MIMNADSAGNQFLKFILVPVHVGLFSLHVLAVTQSRLSGITTDMLTARLRAGAD
jgi:hypothetical protein